jgi:uncharacterized protein (TIGR00255 family)
LRALEPAVRERLNARLGRGKLDCSCRFRPAAAVLSAVTVDPESLAGLLAACREVAERLEQSTPLSPLELLRWPGVVRQEELDSAPLQQYALELLDGALDELIATREREGEKIRELVLQRCAAMADLVASARRLLPEIRVATRGKLLARLAELAVPADPGRLEQELVFLAQKMDVDEPVGRRLDFLMQELNREANTLGSKSAASETTRISVELKVLIEQMREQVQNAE